MTLIKRNHNATGLDQLFDNFFRDEPIHWMNRFRGNSPAVNISENDDAYQIAVNAPGFAKNDFKIEMNQNVLTISAELEEQKEHHETHYNMQEFHTSSFSRSFNLPEGKVDEAKVKASYNAGILKIALPKREEHKPAPSRLIDVK